MMGGRRRVLRHRTEHEVAPRNAGQELGEVVAHGKRPAKDAGLVTDESAPYVEDRFRHVGLVHQGHRSVDEIEAGAHVKLAVRLTKEVAQPAEGLLAKPSVERAQAALHQDAARHDVPRSVTPDIANCRVALPAVLLEALEARKSVV